MQLPETFEQPQKQPDILANIQSLALKSELNDRQVNYLDNLVAQLNKVMDGRTFEQMVGDKDLVGLEKYLKIIKNIRRLLAKQETPEDTLEQEKVMWQSFYKQIFDRDLNFSDLEIPEKKEGFNWLIVVLKGFDIETLINKYKEYIKLDIDSDTYNELLSVKSTRKTFRPYAVWVRDRIESDDEYKNKSTLDCIHEGIKGISLKERLLLGLYQLWQNGVLLDQRHVTLCTGSSDRHLMRTPITYTEKTDHIFVIAFTSKDSSTNDLRTREVISLD